MRFRLGRSIIFFAVALCPLGMDIIISSRLDLDFPLRFLAGITWTCDVAFRAGLGCSASPCSCDEHKTKDPGWCFQPQTWAASYHQNSWEE